MNGMWMALAGQVLYPKAALVASTRTSLSGEWEDLEPVFGIVVNAGKNMAAFYPVPNLRDDEVCE